MSMTSEPVIVRNGRSTSQVSIYDYPEHLNPFYEDENHKRLRFWKIGKKNGDSRRGSFSMAGLKEMWAFKSFRLKKKSSSLGINKTSESPPAMRRGLDPNEQHYGTYDPRMRHTTGVNTINGFFQRNVPYRSSLQDMRSNQDIDSNGYDRSFTRNDRYRSTIQTGYSPRVPSRRYVYDGSVTPQPSIRSNVSDDYRGISRGSSQLSVSSTNPFDGDEDDVVVGRIGTGENDENKSQTSSKPPHRKKRRAPPPPVPVPKIIIEESLSNPATPSTSQINQNETAENIEITNLTAEIENFVKTTTDSPEDEIIKTELDNSKTTSHTNGTSDRIEVNEGSFETESPSKSKESSSEKESSQDFIENGSAQISPEQISLDDNLKVDETMEYTNSSTTMITVNNHTLVEENTANTSTAQTDVETEETLSDTQDINTEEPDLPNVELKITESKEDVSIESETSNETTMSNDGSKFQIRYIPLKDSSPETEPEMRTYTRTHSHEIKESNGEVSYERRRSVKEIIESINRSQSLLKVSQEQIAKAMVDSPVNNLNEPTKVKAPPRKKHEAKENLVRNFNELTSEHEINRMIHEMENSAMIENDENIKESEVDELIEKLTDKLNNNDNTSSELFKKCSIKKEVNRESSPTSSNLDWNPVPKPKRTKNLSPELTKIKTISENVEN